MNRGVEKAHERRAVPRQIRSALNFLRDGRPCSSCGNRATVVHRRGRQETILCGRCAADRGRDDPAS